jgi:hypothetical protein
MFRVRGYLNDSYRSPNPNPTGSHYFLGASGDLTSTSSISKIRVLLGMMILPIPVSLSGQHGGEKGVQVLVLRRGAEPTGRVDQGPGLGQQAPGVGGQMEFRVPR